MECIAEEQMNYLKQDTTFRLSNQMADEEMKSATMKMFNAAVE